MDNTLVSARVTRAKKERGAEVLASIGATASDLINSAYDYVLATGELPSAHASADRPGDADFAAFVKACTIDTPLP